MAASDLINFSGLSGGAKCFAPVHQHRWLKGVHGPVRGSSAVILAKPEVCAGIDATARNLTADAADFLIAPLLFPTIFTTRGLAQEMDIMMQLQAPDPVPPNLPEMPPILPELPEPRPETNRLPPTLN